MPQLIFQAGDGQDRGGRAGGVDVRVISIGALASHPLWGERPLASGSTARTGHSTTTLIRSGSANILVDPGLPEAALIARLAERVNLGPSDITHVFLTSFHPDTHRGIAAFHKATWLISHAEREGVGVPLVTHLHEVNARGEVEVAEVLKREIAILQRCQPAEDSLAHGVDLFPLPGVTPGLTGLLVEQHDVPEAEDLTTLICGDAIATIEHLRQRMVLPNASSVPMAKESFSEAIGIADILILGRDNMTVNTYSDT